MANYKVYENPTNGYRETVKDGFNWPVFFLGPLWYLFNGMFLICLAWGAVIALVATFTFGIGVPIVWIVAGFRANGEKEKNYLRQGWKFIGYQHQLNDDPVVLEDPKNE